MQTCRDVHAECELLCESEVELKTSAAGQQQLSGFICVSLKNCEALARHHISELLTLCSTSTCLRSAYQSLLSIPRTHSKPAIGPKLWNGLPLKTSPWCLHKLFPSTSLLICIICWCPESYCSHTSLIYAVSSHTHTHWESSRNCYKKHEEVKHSRTFCDAPLRRPLSHKALFPVGSSSTSSLVLGGRRTWDQRNSTFCSQKRHTHTKPPNTSRLLLTMLMFPNLSAAAMVS